MTAAHAEMIFEQMTRAFAASQNFARQEVERRQALLLERVVRHADAYSPFYCDSKRLKPLFRPDGSFDLAGWKDVPILSRNEAKSNQDALHARQVPADMGSLETRMTSGSTGTPLTIRLTSAQAIASEVLVNRALRWHDLWPIERIATSTFKATPIHVGPGMLKVPSGIPFADQVDLLRSHSITHAIVKPSVAAAWADIARPGDLPKLKAVMATGEMLLPEVRSKIERKLGAKVVNLYSSNELGPIASEGPEGRLRVNEENLFLEGSSAQDTEGLVEVVATPFYAFGTPLIRYAPGDYIRFSSMRARDAKGLRRLREVVGRRRNLLRQPDGSPFAPDHPRSGRLGAILDHREWQLVQTSLVDIALRIATPRPPTPQQFEALCAYLRKSLPNHNTSVEIVDSIANDMRTGKSFEVFMSLIDANP